MSDYLDNEMDEFNEIVDREIERHRREHPEYYDLNETRRHESVRNINSNALLLSRVKNSFKKTYCDVKNLFSNPIAFVNNIN